MFTMQKIGADRGDCTAPYSVQLDKEYTLKEFIDAILQFKNDEWGYIGIRDNKPFTFGEPKCEYSHGKLLYNMPENILDKKVLQAIADGGWTRMDYLLLIQD